MLSKPCFFAVLLLFLSFSCKQEDNNGLLASSGSKNEDSIERSILLPGDSTGIQELIKEIDFRTVLDSGSSLVYTDNYFNNYKAEVFFTQDKTIKKLRGTIFNTDNLKKVQTYYFEKGKPIFSKTQFYGVLDSTVLEGERWAYYDSVSKVRQVFTIKEINKNFLSNLNKEFDYLDYMLMLNQEKKFKTTFRGFTEMNDITFLIVGTDSYRATLKIPAQFKNEDLDRIRKNPNTFVGCELSIEFLNFIENSMDEDHVLYNLKLLSPC